MSKKKPSLETIAEDARINALDKRLEAAKEREIERSRLSVQGVDANYRSGNRVLADLIGGILGGAVIGWVIDFFAGTSPWGLLVMMFMGTIVAFRNVFKAATAHQRQSDSEAQGSE